MKKLKLYFIDTNYINYLRKYDKRVAYNKVPNRPYVGVVYMKNDRKIEGSEMLEAVRERTIF